MQLLYPLPIHDIHLLTRAGIIMKSSLSFHYHCLLRRLSLVPFWSIAQDSAHVCKTSWLLYVIPQCNLLHNSRKLHVICYTILESFTIEAQYHCQTFSMGFATSVVRAKKDKLDQENAEDATANSKNRSQQPIGIMWSTTAAASPPCPAALDVQRSLHYRSWTELWPKLCELCRREIGKRGVWLLTLGCCLHLNSIFSVPYPLILLGAWEYIEWMYVAGCT